MIAFRVVECLCLCFNDWVGWLCCVDRIVPDAIYKPVTIKLLVSGLLT